ncbi:FGGY family carbohydrate kinase [Burkholderia sp. THE68]|uniref:FGGY family carbohydrate kinase n=1 Tax=Burkholderia sp. THE68 TaxID=758782 RepID=UPI00256FECC7|nr:FGGY family carbohydrate kinase [Burkholderia sp. THE68]
MGEAPLSCVSSDGSIVGTARHPLEISRPRHRWSEQDPDDWWQASGIALSTLRNSHSDAFARVQAIGLSG